MDARVKPAHDAEFGASVGNMLQLQSALGIAALVVFAWAISENRRLVSPRRVLAGLAISIILAVLFLKVPPVTRADRA